MKEIRLTQGQFALVDDEDFDFLNQWKWYVMIAGNHKYAMRKTSRKNIPIRETIFMHRAIMNPSNNMEIDHIDNNGLNNQKCNLRICTHGQNQINKNITGKSKYLGVYWITGTKYIYSAIKYNSKLIRLGSFKTEEEAARAFDKAAIIYHGEFAHLNFPAVINGEIKHIDNGKP